MHDERDSRAFATIFTSKLVSVNPGRWGLGVVGNVAVYLTRRFSILQIHFANGELRLLGVDGLHNDLIGEVVFLFPHFGRLYLCTTDGSKFFVNADEVEDPF